MNRNETLRDYALSLIGEVAAKRIRDRQPLEESPVPAKKQKPLRRNLEPAQADFWHRTAEAGGPPKHPPMKS